MDPTFRSPSATRDALHRQAPAAATLLAALLSWHLVQTDAGAWLVAGVAMLGLNLTIWWRSERGVSTGSPDDERARPGLEALSEVESALRRDLRTCRLLLQYRPVRRLPDGPSLALQAQARWNHPQKGLLPCTALEALAQGWDLDGELFDATLAQACRQFVAWRREGALDVPQMLVLDVPLAQAGRADLADRVARVLAQTGMPARELQLHWPEAAFAVASAGPLLAAGVCLAASGFGRAGSSLGALQSWPVQAVVLDADLVSRITGAGHERLVVEATVRLAASLHMTTVADGVTTTALAQALADLGCEAGQGDVLGPWLDGPAWSRRWAVPQPAPAD